MKYKIKDEFKQEVLDLLLRRRATTAPRIKNIVLSNKAMYLPKWVKYFSLEEMDTYLEPAMTIEELEGTKNTKHDDIKEPKNIKEEENEEYYGI